MNKFDVCIEIVSKLNNCFRSVLVRKEIIRILSKQLTKYQGLDPVYAVYFMFQMFNRQASLAGCHLGCHGNASYLFEELVLKLK